MKSISLLTYTKNEDEVDDKCEGFKKVSIEIIQGYEYTSSGNVCKNKCKIRCKIPKHYYRVDSNTQKLLRRR